MRSFLKDSEKDGTALVRESPSSAAEGKQKNGPSRNKLEGAVLVLCIVRLT